MRGSGEKRPQVTAHVDGGCVDNPGLVTWGAVLCYGPHVKELSGLEGQGTNQRAEIIAATRALSALKVPCDVLLVSDSEYLVRTMNGDYRRKKNLELWQQLDEAAAAHKISWTWCAGHAGDPGNERAHQLTEMALNGETGRINFGYRARDCSKARGAAISARRGG